MTAEQIVSLAHSDSAIAHDIQRYSRLGSAIEASYHGEKMRMVVMGDDGRFWVMRPAWAQKLERAGYEVAR
jgi:hypothetical protein